jgi:predicted enzyme related to lactoylglutathione lyase
VNDTATVETPVTATPIPATPIKAKKVKIKKSAFPKKAAYFILYVPDMAKAVDFYRNKIGLKLGFESPEWTEFKSGIKFALHATGACAAKSGESSSCATAYVPQKTGLCFGVKDAGKTYAVFQALGVKVLGEPHQVCEDGRSFSFQDPFGNEFSIYGK